MVRVRVGRIVQNDRLGEVPPEDAEIFDVVAENAGAIILIQTMSAKETMLETLTPVSVDQLCQYVTCEMCVSLALNKISIYLNSQTILLSAEEWLCCILNHYEVWLALSRGVVSNYTLDKDISDIKTNLIH